MNPKVGSFSAYLEYAERSKNESAKAVSGPLGLLNVLAQAPNSELPFDLLLKLSAMDAGAFRDALKDLRDAGFIQVSGATLEETVKLTPKGTEVAKLA
jgi:hypothetical protein